MLFEHDTRIKIYTLILIFTVGVVIRFFKKIEINDEPVRNNFEPTLTLTGSTYAGTASQNATTL